MHRMDYKACREAGFESPGELLAAYQRLVAAPKEEMQPVRQAAAVGAQVMGRVYDGVCELNSIGRALPDNTPLYAAPPAADVRDPVAEQRPEKELPPDVQVHPTSDSAEQD